MPGNFQLHNFNQDCLYKVYKI